MNIEELYTRYKSHIFLLCMRYIRCRADAEDVVQSVFLKAWRSLHTFQHRSDYFTWLYRIAVNECLNYLKKNRRQMIIFDETLLPDLSESEVSIAERKLIWNHVLHSMNRTEQFFILLLIFEGMDMSEVSVVLGISRQAVHKKWKKIRCSIQKRIRGNL